MSDKPKDGGPATDWATLHRELSVAASDPGFYGAAWLMKKHVTQILEAFTLAVQVPQIHQKIEYWLDDLEAIEGGEPVDGDPMRTVNLVIKSMRRFIDKTESELPCSGCGMVYPGKPSYTSWACDKCLQETTDPQNEYLNRFVKELISVIQGLKSEYLIQDADVVIAAAERRAREAYNASSDSDVVGQPPTSENSL